MKETIVVVGANHAGTHALLAMENSNHEIIAFDRNDNICFLGCGIALWVSNVIKDPEVLFYANEKLLKDKGINIKSSHDVVDVDYNKKEVTVINLKTNEKFTQAFDKLIIACGSWPVVPPIEGVELKNVEIIKLFQHGQALIEKLKNKDIKRVAVIGAGYIGVEIVEALNINQREVYLVNNAGVLSTYFDETYQEAMAENMRDMGINVLTNCNVTAIKGQSQVESIVTTQGEIEVDLVIIATGFKPITEAFKKPLLKTLGNGAIIVDKHMESSIKDVYAVGDCAALKSGVTGEYVNIALASNALRSGLVAGNNAIGNILEMPPIQGSNAICINNLVLASTGLNEAAATNSGFNVRSVTITDHLKPLFMEDNHEVTVTLTYDVVTTKVLGFQIMAKCDITLIIHMFSLAIQKGCTIEEIYLLDTFFLPHFNQPHNFIMMIGQAAYLDYKKVTQK